MIGRIRQKLGGVEITPTGWVVIVLIPVSLAVSLAGPRSAQTPAFVVLLIVALAAVTAAGGSLRGNRYKGLAQRRRDFRPRDREDGVAQVAEADDSAWQRERERREREGRNS